MRSRKKKETDLIGFVEFVLLTIIALMLIARVYEDNHPVMAAERQEELVEALPVIKERDPEPIIIAISDAETGAPAAGIMTAPAVGETEGQGIEETDSEEPDVDPDELYVLAHLICGECQDGSWELQEAVGSVVLNRVASPNYPDTIKKVVFQKGQYACTWDGNYDRTPTARNWEVAEYLLRNGSQLPPDVVFQAQFKQGNYIYKKIGNEYFCGKR